MPELQIPQKSVKMQRNVALVARFSRVTRHASRAFASKSDIPTESAEPMNDLFVDLFDKPKNWGMMELKVVDRPGRAWTHEELRGKSNDDLHCIWFILLKERNMLLTMQKENVRNYRRMPNEERIDKVEESMAALEAVVQERNSAYSLLEFGHSGERPTKTVTSFAGFTHDEPLTEHLTPPTAEDKNYETPILDDDQQMMQMMWNEKEYESEQLDREQYMRRKGTAKLWYSSMREFQPFLDAHPKARREKGEK